MKGTVIIEKSFDETRKFSKELNSGDLKEFFGEEGEYLDGLVETAKNHKGSGYFTVTYTVKVEA